MKKLLLTLSFLLAVGTAAYAQDDAAVEEESENPRDLQYWRPYDQRGVNVFETSKETDVEFDGVKVRLGGAFTQQFQGLGHSNRADFVDADLDGVNDNELIELGDGFNLATANLNIDAALAPGIRINVVTYLSSRHHPESWVKGGYIQVDQMPFINSGLLDNLMESVTVKVGHMEINYGDMHFRRSDNAHALYNPFVGNLIMDAFATEVGAEIYYQKNGLLLMAAATDGEIRGGLTRPDDRAPSFYGKVGYDKQLNESLRVRITGSYYTTSSSLNNTLYNGDRAGSRYYSVLENTTSSVSSDFTSGRFTPNFRDKNTAWVINPFVKFGGLEFFGNIEFAEGRLGGEPEERMASQYAAELLYRFGKNERFYVGGRWNQVTSEEPNFVPNTDPNEVSIQRIQFGGGWFLTPNILMKAEYVQQDYTDFVSTSIFHEGNFSGVNVEAVVAF